MAGDVELVVEPGPGEAAGRLAALLAAAARAGLSIALSGGSTPGAAYARAAELEPDWSRATVWLADERLVPPDDARSNARLVREALLDRVARRPRFEPVPAGATPAEAARRFDAALRAGPRPELVVLGVGADGHTASLFPGAPTLAETEALAAAAEPGLAPFVPRVTLTLPAIAGAGEVVFLATGAAKAEAARRAFAEPPSQDTPASLVRSAAGRTTAILDAAAASLLAGDERRT